MNKHYYTIQLDVDTPVIIRETLEEVFTFLKKQKVFSVLRYNDSKTGAAYTKAATEQNLTIEEQEQSPVCVKTVLSDEATFVKDEAFWLKNYMLDEFYIPDRFPFIEKFINHNDTNL